MIIYRNRLEQYKHVTFTEEVTLSPKFYEGSSVIKDIKPLQVSALCFETGEFVMITLHIKGNATLISGYSLKPFEYKIDCEDSITITDDKETETEHTMFCDKSTIDIDHMIYSLLYCSLPLNPVKTGEEFPKSGSFYSVKKEK